MRENAWRSIAKALSWRVSGSIGTMCIAYLFSRRLTVAVSIGAVEFIAKIGMYYLHERLWDRISYGRKQSADPDYNI